MYDWDYLITWPFVLSCQVFSLAQLVHVSLSELDSTEMKCQIITQWLYWKGDNATDECIVHKCKIYKCFKWLNASDNVHVYPML